jgi:molybdopterin molybdotransferase
MALISVEEALARVLDGVEATAPEPVGIRAARGRVLAEPLAALLTQPPFDAAAMDGYAVRAADVATLPAALTVIGEAAAGHPFAGSVGAGEAVRISTGAPVPAGADAVVAQENAGREGDRVVVQGCRVETGHIRTKGIDFRAGDTLLLPGRTLGPREVSLAAAMGHAGVAVRRRPRVAILATGDELVEPGGRPGPGQIVASNHLGVAALAEAAGAEATLLGIARDQPDDLGAHLAEAPDADIVATIGGASVGDHDLVGAVLKGRGMTLSFWKIAMAPGKPLMYGRLGGSRVLGLPGNPVSALVCARLFLVPLIHKMLGRPSEHGRPVEARLAVALEANDARQRYLRAVSRPSSTDGSRLVTPVRSQDSSLLSPLAEADCLLVRPPHAPAAASGAVVPILPLDF